MSSSIEETKAMCNPLNLTGKLDFLRLRTECKATIAEAMSQVVNSLFNQAQLEVVQKIANAANRLDELWKQESAIAEARTDLVVRMSEMCMRNELEAVQQKSALEKKIEELEAKLAANVRVLDQFESKSHSDSNAGARRKRRSPDANVVPGRGGSDGTPSLERKAEFVPRITAGSLQEVFKWKNYYSSNQFEAKVTPYLLKWKRRSSAQLASYSTSVQTALTKIRETLKITLTDLPKILIKEVAISRLLVTKILDDTKAEEASLMRAQLQEKQEQERRQLKRSLENQKRFQEDIRSSMAAVRNGPNVHFQERADVSEPDEYDVDDDFVVPDDEEEEDDYTDADDDVGALSDAVNELAMESRRSRRAPVQSLDN